jgi:hypothetical protein
MGFDRNTYETPQWLFDHYNGQCNFAWDLACSPQNCKAPKGIYEGSLMAGWNNLARNEWLWLNPPYKPLKPWYEKAVDAASLGAKIVMLVPMQTIGTLYFQPWAHYRMDFIRGRVSFCYRGVPVKGNEHCSVVLFFDRSRHGQEAQPIINWLDAEKTENEWILS